MARTERPKNARPAAKMSLFRRRPCSWILSYSDVERVSLEVADSASFVDGDGSSRRRFSCGRIESAGGGNLKLEKRELNQDIVMFRQGGKGQTLERSTWLGYVYLKGTSACAVTVCAHGES